MISRDSHFSLAEVLKVLSSIAIVIIYLSPVSLIPMASGNCVAQLEEFYFPILLAPALSLFIRIIILRLGLFPIFNAILSVLASSSSNSSGLLRENHRVFSSGPTYSMIRGNCETRKLAADVFGINPMFST